MERRVIRGGSCRYRYWSVSTADTKWIAPGIRSRNRGFRMVIGRSDE